MRWNIEKTNILENFSNNQFIKNLKFPDVRLARGPQPSLVLVLRRVDIDAGDFTCLYLRCRHGSTGL
jgi:hypothetical protein